MKHDNFVIKGSTHRMLGVRDPWMLIKVKKNYMRYFCQNTYIKPLGEKHFGKKFCLNHPTVQERRECQKPTIK